MPPPAVPDLPAWDLSYLIPNPAGAEMAAHLTWLTTRLEQLHAQLGTRQSTAPDALSAVITALDAVLHDADAVDVAFMCHELVGSADDMVRSHGSALAGLRQRYQQLLEQIEYWAAQLDLEQLHAAEPHTLAYRHLPLLASLRQRAEHRMVVDEASLASSLADTGSIAWTRLYGDLSATLSIEVAVDGVVQTVPVSASQRFAFHPGRAVRSQAADAERRAWTSVAGPAAAALNSIKGEVLTLTRRRGWATPLEQSLAENRMDQATLDAHQAAVRALAPDLRRYFAIKAHLLDVDALAWFDLYAPLDASLPAWSFAEAQARVLDVCQRFSPSLGALARRAVTEGWIDAAPRPGKRGGGLTMALGDGTARIMLNFTATPFGVRQLAHELGHAWHNAVLQQHGCTMLQRAWTPWVLGETASLLAETLVRQELVRTARPSEERALLDVSLQQVARILEHDAAFRFEQTLFERRRERALAADELTALMRASLMEGYGSALDPATLPGHRWISLPQLYNAAASYGNYPYTFGILFALGLLAHGAEEPDRFPTMIEELLALSGTVDVPDLAVRFGIDVRDPAFWTLGADVIRADVHRLTALAEQ